MLVDIKNINDVHTVKKPWGYEKWIADGNPNFSYALKEIFSKLHIEQVFNFINLKKKQIMFKAVRGFYSIQRIP